jgi:MarR family transcriptional regulator, 2-MHQ and catechol-resistance regulon repressor
MNHACHNIDKLDNWQDGLEDLSQDIKECADNLNNNPIFACIKIIYTATKSIHKQLTVLDKYKSISPMQAILLHTVILHGGRMSPKKISNEILRSKYAITRIVDSLEKKKLVRREPFMDDLRTRDIIITRKGIQIINERTEYIQKKLIPEILHNLTIKQKEDLNKLLQIKIS